MRILVAWGCAVLLTAGLAMAGDAKDDKAKLQGKWTYETEAKKLELQFDKDNFTVVITFTKDKKSESATFKGTFTIDAQKKPKHIDMKVVEGQGFAGQTSLGIYDIEGDTLKWCANGPGKDKRPAEFPPKEGEVDDILYVKLKRAK
jgi:uncharacterized protein (TIGR03067 family)